jgi:VWFA-related protein
MRTGLILFCWLSVCLGQESIRVDVRLVNVGFSVRDAQNQLVTDLDRADFEVLEDGIAQKIAFFSRGSELPLRLGLIEDFSSSQGQFLKTHQKHLETFLKATVSPRDQAFFVAFATDPWVVRESTASPEQLIEAVKSFDRDKARRRYPQLGPVEVRDHCCNTAFYDAVFYSIRQLLNSGETGRKAAILFSDGDDRLSARNLMDVIEEAQYHDVALFPLRYIEKDGKATARHKYGESVMKRLARETGGMDFDATEGDVGRYFKEIADQLRFSYELAYYSSAPPGDPAFRKISIKVKRPGIRVHSKTGYYSR